MNEIAYSRFFSICLGFLWLPSLLLGSPIDLLGSLRQLLVSYIELILDFSRFFSVCLGAEIVIHLCMLDRVC